ncbi:MAG: helix-turn-helix transcriptional regulator [Anaerolineae bacterium]|nr:helix-turn-helix transcriptional regulator [Anaerolineae bacterium]
MKTLAELKAKYMQDADFEEEYDLLEETYRIAEKVIQARIAAGLTQAELARIIGTKQANISRLESGTYNPTVDLLMKIAEATGNRLEVNFVN